ncbi:MAG: pilus assembly protein [Gammaproteobacteria bacterium]|nr:pilus assembly protein [Gammaproteobacteria bacterium]
MMNIQSYDAQLRRGLLFPDRHQRGSSLIAVLLILLLITVLGVYAMRQGLATLNISTNAQVRQLLVQSSDTVLNGFTQTDVNTLTNAAGAIGLAMINQQAAVSSSVSSAEYVFCYRPATTQGFAQSQNTNVIAASTTDQATLLDGGHGGFCDLTADFGSNRKAAVTQVAVTLPRDTAPIGAYLVQGTWSAQLPSGVTNPQRVRITATSMLPAFSNTPVSTVQTTCLGSTDGSTAGRISDNTLQLQTNPSTAPESLTDCLSRLGVPANTQVQEYNAIATLCPAGTTC